MSNEMEHATLIASFLMTKGGVGKTTISCNVSHILSLAGYRVLHVDGDTQGSSTDLLEAYQNGRVLSKMDLLKMDTAAFFIEDLKDNARRYICQTRYPNIDLIPNTPPLEAVTAEDPEPMSMDNIFFASTDPNKYFHFRQNLEQIASDYDFIIIDGSGHSDALLTSTIIASDVIFSPITNDCFTDPVITKLLSRIKGTQAKYLSGYYKEESNLLEDRQFQGFFLNSFIKESDSYAIMKKRLLRQKFEDKYNARFIEQSIRHSESVGKRNSMQVMWLEEDMRNSWAKTAAPTVDLIKLIIQYMRFMDQEHEDRLEQYIRTVKTDKTFPYEEVFHYVGE